MKILSLDSSSSVASVAMVESSTDPQQRTLLYQHHKTHERNNSSVFFEGLETAIREHGLPERMVVGLGPGSYNGLRASIAAAQGIASSSKIMLTGLSSALAFEEGALGCWVLGDARGNHYWLAAVQNHQFIQEPQLALPEAIPEILATHPSFPLLAYSPLSKLPILQSQLIIKTPNAVLLAEISEKTQQKEYELSRLEPLYLKPPHITAPRQS